jgi:hypothetical protein
MSVLLYAAETWTITQKDACKLKTFHMKCIRDILGITRRDMIRNEVVLRLANKVEISEQLHKLRLQWFGHIMCMPEVRTQHRLLCSRLSDNML